MAAGGPAGAETKRTAPYPYSQVWPTAVRFLRIDENHEILEKDGDAGYVIFAVDDDGKRFRGTLELVRVVDDGRPAVRLTVDIEDRPAYMEAGILDRMLIKLRAEHGPPAAPPPEPEPKPTEPEPKADD